MTKRKIEIVLVLVMVNLSLFAQDLTQTVRGRAIDNDSKLPMIGANIIIMDSDPFLGASADIDGYFVIENVPVGRVNIKVSAIGYETQVLSNIIVETGKEAFLDIKCVESFETLAEVTITATEEKNEVINKMAMVSGKTVTVEETGRYAGSLNDPARMVSAFAGVTGDPAGNNDIVVRGNSPRGILWRLEGIEIPNPNHFAGEGTTGGPVNTLNASMLANSDFFSGAFAPEYGNALSGVFDTRFRTGNNQKREYSFSIGVLGTDITMEGPFSKNYNGSYLVNYRYSTLELLDNAGIVDFGGVPQYQDGSFKVNLPTKSSGNFTVFGLFGKSAIHQELIEEESELVTEKAVMKAGLSIMGVKHNYIINKKTYVQSFVSFSNTYNGMDQLWLDGISTYYDAINNEFRENKYQVSTSLNKKINTRNTVNAGIIYTYMGYNMLAKDNLNNTYPVTRVDAKGNTGMMQLYSTWKYRLREDLTMVSGIHYTQLMLNDNYSLEPRLGLKWQLNTKQYLSLGLGMHSKIENLSVYMASDTDDSGSYMNKDLELTKAAHYVLGFGHRFTENLFFKTEIYYQHLYDVPVENAPNSSFSMINESGVYSNVPLISSGTGTNYGAELTLERFYSNNFYYMVTTSLYQSKYSALDGIERNTRFNANYACNLVIGKEFKLPSKKKNKTLAVNIKTSLLGGNMYSPIDLESSINAGKTVYYSDKIFTEKADDVFYVNLGITYRVNRKKTTHEIKLDIQNLTNNEAIVAEYYNPQQEKIILVPQLSMIPNIMYIIKF